MSVSAGLWVQEDYSEDRSGFLRLFPTHVTNSIRKGFRKNLLTQLHVVSQKKTESLEVATDLEG
jgi:hypothetical protein